MTQVKQEINLTPIFQFPHTHTLLEETGRELARRAGVENTDEGEPTAWGRAALQASPRIGGEIGRNSGVELPKEAAEQIMTMIGQMASEIADTFTEEEMEKFKAIVLSQSAN